MRVTLTLFLKVACCVCVLGLQRSVLRARGRVAGHGGKKFLGTALRSNSVYKDLLEESDPHNSIEKLTAEIPVQDIDFSVKSIPETFVENSEHVIELESLNTSSNALTAIEGFEIPTATPSIEEDLNQEEEYEYLYLKAQHSEVVRYSSEGWFWVLFSLGKSNILRRISKHVIASLLWTGMLTMLHMRGLLKKFVIRDPGPINLLIGQLSLLLVFRTNSAYERTWMSRGLLEDLVNCSRQLAITLKRALRAAAMDEARTTELKNRYVAMITMLPKLLLTHVAYEAETSRLVKSSDMNFDDQCCVLEASNAPLRCIQLMQDSLEALPSRSIDQYRSQISSIFERLVNIIGGAERVVRTPVPKSYSRHTSRFLSITVMYYPLVLLPSIGIRTIPTMLFFCWALMGVEEIGHIIENPWEPQVRNDLLNTEHVVDIINKDVKDIMRFQEM